MLDNSLVTTHRAPTGHRVRGAADHHLGLGGAAHECEGPQVLGLRGQSCECGRLSEMWLRARDDYREGERGAERGTGRREKGYSCLQVGAGIMYVERIRYI